MRYQSESYLVSLHFLGAVCWWLLLHYTLCCVYLNFARRLILFEGRSFVCTRNCKASWYILLPCTVVIRKQGYGKQKELN